MWMRILSCLILTMSLESVLRAEIDFSRDIKPILADNCFRCHGLDAKDTKADLRLDLRDVAIKKGAINPDTPKESELLKRIFATNKDDIMPPPESHKELTLKQKRLLKQWIEEGAKYQEHWSFIKPVRPALPQADNDQWAKNEVDRFVLKTFTDNQLTPSRPASREKLVRRVSLDVRGLPPTIEEIDAFVNDSRSDDEAYAAMVDRMLASPHFGEKMARVWMDLGRYGDTNGYHYDSTRQVWLWRDWVINAYNNNMPFDQFTVEQLAGDLMPNATQDQQIASGFNRNTRYNEEGGADPDEWRVSYAKDRVNTLGQVWMGITTGCAECHNHKYDPFTQKEYYQIYAFFNSLNEPGAQGHRQKYPPLLKIETDEHRQLVKQKNIAVAEAEHQIKELLAKTNYCEPDKLPEAPVSASKDNVWIEDNLPEGASPAGEGSPAWDWVTSIGDGQAVHSGSRATRRSGSGLNQHFFSGAKNQLTVAEDTVFFAHVWLDPKNPPKTVQLQFNDGSWNHRARWGEDRGHGAGGKGPANFHAGDLPKTGEWVRLEVTAKDVGIKPGAKLNGWAFTQFDGTVYYDNAGITQRIPDTRHTLSLAFWETKAAKDKNVPGNIKNIIKVKSDKRNDKQRKELVNYYVQHVFADTAGEFGKLRAKIDAAKAAIKKSDEALPFQLVSEEMASPREAFMLIRGNFQKLGDKVTRDTPAAFPAFPEGEPRNRLGLARWLVSPDHPLTARVTVNRYWAQLFGRGIVTTLGDFGQLGQFPTHRELLDWLAVEFVESGWNTKHIMRLILTSAAYRQDSANDMRHADADPQNKLLWRMPRFRMPAEEIRDSALSVAGMLSREVGGRPVFPYQPKDYYKGKKGGWTWNLSKGENRYRRGLYTFWRRTTPYPTFIIFDAPDRSQCEVSRARTNTPLQALATMNDPQFVEAARVLAQRVLVEMPDSLDRQLEHAFRLALSRKPSDQERTVLKAALDEHRKYYQAYPDAAKEIANYGDFERPEELDAVAHASWVAIANSILNLDEMIMRE